ncbi:hypothetical protein CgunFtcFv8_013650 [Champsocephalus gunnari]|uniref:Uncharacterized protein n=1 Tax=Champsocephalus gunnari TaxID=52237 RepID=A0AAN8HUP7_CHAGU|nr:hypothetical protein CgunFtcFv8_013650 [Champsocephalus gunnari]
MEGVAVDNLTDFALASEATAVRIKGGQHQGHTDMSSPEQAPSMQQQQQPLLPEPTSPAQPSSQQQPPEEGPQSQRCH